MHWFTLAVAAICCFVPTLAPVASYIVKMLGASARVAKTLLPVVLPILLKV